jgi:hypothetical protein
VVFNQTLYWAAAATSSSIYGWPLGGATAKSFPAPGGLYPDGNLLADANGLYALTSGTGDAAQNDSKFAQLLRFDYDGKLIGMDALGTRVVQQFAQDDGGFYLAINVDEKVPDGQPFQRTTSVVRYDKLSHARSTVLNEQTLTISDYHYNGYLGVVSDGATLYALYETAPGSNRHEHLQIKRVVDLAQAEPSDPTPIYDLEVSASPRYTSLRLLGTVDGALLFARDEFETNLQTVRSSSLLAIAAGSTTVHFVADFADEWPVQGIASSSDQLFWLNQTGRLFALPRKVLRSTP